tara:strand:+ start:1990 stop:2148 length:159 start_codon:yes stop_codon:yes gene_type:complete
MQKSQIEIQDIFNKLSPQGKLEWENAALKAQIEVLTERLTELEQQDGNELSE